MIFHNHFLAEKPSHGIAELFAGCYIVCYNVIGHQRTDTIMDYHNVVIANTLFPQPQQAIAGGLEIAVTTREHPLEFGNAVLVGISL